MSECSPRFSGKRVGEIIDRTGVTSTTKLLIIAASCGYLFDAFDNNLLGSLMPILSKEFIITQAMKGLILSLAMWGGVFGMLFWGPIAEIKGRRYAFCGTLLLFSFFTSLTSFAWSPYSIGITRFFAGFGLAGFLPVDMTMVSEMAPTRLRGRLTGSLSILWPVGTFLATLSTLFLFHKIGWRGMFLLAILPALAVYIMRRHVPESPRWLASKGREQDALVALTKMGATNETIDDVMKSVPYDVTDAETARDKDSMKAKYGELFSRKYFASNIVAWSLWISGNFAAWGVALWLPSILVDVYHFTIVRSLTYTIISISSSLCGRFTGVYLVEKIGRKTLIVYAFSLTAIICLAIGNLGNPHYLLPLIIAYGFFEAQSLVGVMSYIPELYPTRLRAVGNAYAASSSRITSALAPIMVGALMGINLYHLIWVIFAAVYMIAIVILLVFGPETRGVVLEDIVR